MNFRWLLFDYVDPALNLSRAERQAVRRRARQRVRLTWRNTLITVFLILPLLALYVWGVVHYSERFVSAVVPQGGVLLRVLIVYIAIWIVVAWLGRWMYRPFVRGALNELGHHVCVECGYDLRGSPAEARCPECGEVRSSS